MIIKRLITSRRAFLYAKLSAIVIFIFLFSGVVFLQIKASQDRGRLVGELNQAVKEKDNLSLQVARVQNSLEPLKKEIGYLRAMYLNNKNNEITAEPKSDERDARPVKTRGRKKDSAPPIKKNDVISGIEKRLANIKSYKNSIDEQNSQLKDKLNELMALLEGREDDLIRLKKHNSNIEKELSSSRNIQEELRKQLESGQQERQGLKQVIAQKESLERLVNGLNSQLTLLKESNASLEKQILQYGQERLVLEKDLNTTKLGIEKYTADNQALGGRIAEFTNSLNARENEKALLAKEIEDLMSAKARTEQELKDMAAARKADQAQAEQLSLKIGELSLSSESMKNTINQLSGLLSKKESEIYSARNEIILLKEDASRTAKERDAYYLALESREKNITALNSKLSQIESQYSSLQAELAGAKDLQNKTAQQLTGMKATNASLKDKFLSITRALAPIDIDVEQENSLDRIRADELRKKIEIELDMDKDALDGQ